MNTLGKRIVAIRGKEPQEAYAARIGVSKAAIGGYERDINLPSSEVIVKICQADNISPNWLLLGLGEMKTNENAVAPPVENPFSVENLQRRVDELEERNQALKELIESMKAAGAEREQIMKASLELLEHYKQGAPIQRRNNKSQN